MVFIMDMILKLIAFGLKEYCKNSWNLFDGTIVILSILDMVLTYSGAISGAGLSVLRTFRLVCDYIILRFKREFFLLLTSVRQKRTSSFFCKDSILRPCDLSVQCSTTELPRTQR